MKIKVISYLLLLMLIAVSGSMPVSCGTKKTEPIIIKAEPPCGCEDSTRIDMLEGRILLLENLAAKRKLEFDSVNTKLFIANYKVERVRYYLNICLRNPGQDKFLKGWVKRAIE